MLQPKKNSRTRKSVSINFKINPNRLSIEEYTTVLEKWTDFFAQIQKSHPSIKIHAEIDFR